MSGAARVALLATLWMGCGDTRVWSRGPDAPAAPLAADQPVRITRAAPPRGARYRGEVAFVTRAAHLGWCFTDVRRRARALGGNLVARLRCRRARELELGVRIDLRLDVREDGPLRAGEPVHCYGRVYRTPGRAPP